MNETITITFGDQAENHVGMQKIGKLCEKGFILDDLLKFQDWAKQRDLNTELINLHDYMPNNTFDVEPAYLLIVRNGVQGLLDGINKSIKGYSIDDFLKEQKSLEWDKKAYMYGRVVNKKVRYNLTFSDKSQEPNYELGMGRVIPFTDVPILLYIKDKISSIIPNASNLVAEGNYYYNTKSTYIGFHGDTERRKVIGIRLGSSFPLYFRWYHNSSPIGNLYEVQLNNGDIYIMSEKTVGSDWKKKKIPTLRHAAGNKKLVGL